MVPPEWVALRSQVATLQAPQTVPSNTPKKPTPDVVDPFWVPFFRDFIN
jgi:hypothetical protein